MKPRAPRSLPLGVRAPRAGVLLPQAEAPAPLPDPAPVCGAGVGCLLVKWRGSVNGRATDSFPKGLAVQSANRGNPLVRVVKRLLRSRCLLVVHALAVSALFLAAGSAAAWLPANGLEGACSGVFGTWEGVTSTTAADSGST